MVRKTEGIREWHNCLELFLTRSKTAEETKMESTEQFWDRAVKNEDTKSKDNLGKGRFPNFHIGKFGKFSQPLLTPQHPPHVT